MRTTILTGLFLLAIGFTAHTFAQKTTDAPREPRIVGLPAVKSTISVEHAFDSMANKQPGTTHIQWLMGDTATGDFAPMQGVTGRRCVLGANLAGKWLKAEIQPEDAAGQPGATLKTRPVQIQDRPGNPNVDFMARNPLGLSFTFDREYIQRCAANDAEKIQKQADGKQENWEEVLATFDVKTFTKEVKSTGAGYVIFALGQNSGYFCSPNSAIEKAAGCAPHTLCSKRDLPLEIMRALKPQGIPVILYLPGNPPSLNPAICAAMGWPGDQGPAPSQLTIRKWNEVIEEWSVRYGKDLAGWWIDGMWGGETTYNMSLAENWHSRAVALKAGNPACAITLNEGGKMRTPCPYIDMTDGESNNLGPTPPHGRWNDPVNRVQWFLYTFIGDNDPHYAGWGNRGVCRTVKDLDNWLGKVFTKGGAVTLDVKVNRFGHLDPDQLKLLQDTPSCHGKYPPHDPVHYNDNDDALTYAGDWVYYGGRPGDYEGDVHAATQDGASFVFTFKGTGVDMIAERNVDLGDVDIYLDEQFKETVHCHDTGKSTQQLLYSVAGCSNGQHTLKGVKKGGQYMAVDLFKIKP